MSDGTISWRQLQAELVERLASEQEARWLCREASGRDATEWVLGLDDPVGARAVARVDAMVARRLAGEPIQYVLGSWSFRSLDLMVDPRVLIPRPETEEVVGWALEAVAGFDPPVRGVDLGTGTGAIALALASELPRRWELELWAVDASSDALDVARANLAGTPGWAAPRVRIEHGSWFDALPRELAGSIDLVVSNPPYVADDEVLDASVTDWEPAGALRAGPDGLDALRAIVAEAPRWLSRRGVLVVEHGAGQGRVVAELARAAGFGAVSTRRDLAGHERALVARV